MLANTWTTSKRSSAQGNCVQAFWKKSSRSGTNGCIEVKKSSHNGSNSCVGVGVVRTSSHTTNGSCVEVEGLSNGWVAVRDSKQVRVFGEDSPLVEVIHFSPEQWESILFAIRGNIFDWNDFSPLVFTEAEKEAFVLGVLDGEFDLAEEMV